MLLVFEMFLILLPHFSVVLVMQTEDLYVSLKWIVFYDLKDLMTCFNILLKYTLMPQLNSAQIRKRKKMSKQAIIKKN